MSNLPYPGLRPYQNNESDIFFGREEHINQMLNKLGRSRFLAVIGPSGCGKSSLVYAGLVPGIEVGFLPDTGVHWRMAKMRPGLHPMKHLAEALLEEDCLGHVRGSGPDSVHFVEATLRRGPLGLLEVLKEARLPKHINLLLIIDQFEEIFRYRRLGGIDESDAFVALLLETARNPKKSVYIIITMRADFLGDCALFPGFPETMNESQYLTPNILREQRRAAIVGPASVFGGKVEPNLVNFILNTIGPNPDRLPIMQHLLARMWTLASNKAPSKQNKNSAIKDVQNNKGIILTLSGYKEAGGITSALSKHADEAFIELNEEGQRIAEVLFRSLGERGLDLRDIRRPARMSEVASVAKVTVDKVSKVVEAFRRPDRYFITPRAGIPLRPNTILDISHESLIRQWKRMQRWVEEEAASANIYRRLRETALLWKQGKATLWSSFDLENARVWKKHENPTSEWAKRYGGDFDLVMEFLEASEQKYLRVQIKVEKLRQKELKQARKQAGTFLIGFVVAIALAFWGYYESERAKDAKSVAIYESERAKDAESQAMNDRNRAQEIQKKRTEGLFESYLTHGSLLVRNEDYEGARKVLAQSKKLDKDIKATRHHARNLLAWYTDLMGGESLKVFSKAGIAFQDVALSPDGKILVAVGENGSVVVFDVESGESINHLKGHTDVVKKVVFHPEGKWLATAGNDSRIIIWSMPRGKKLRVRKTQGGVWALAISPNGAFMASGGTDNSITIWNMITGKMGKKLIGHTDYINDIAFSPDSRLLVSASDDHTTRIWNFRKGKTLHTLKGHTSKVEGVALSPTGRMLATSSKDKTIRLWNMGSKKQIRVLNGHRNIVFGLAFIDSGRRLVSASRDRTLRIWDIDSGVTLNVLQGHKAAVGYLATDADGGKIFSASNDGTIRQWNGRLEDNKRGIRIVDVPSSPNASSISPDGSAVAAGFADGAIRLYNLSDTRLFWEPEKAHKDDIKRLTFSSDSNYLASASFDETIKLWRVKNKKLERTFEKQGAAARDIIFAPNGRFLVSAGYNGLISLLNLDTGKGQFYKTHNRKNVNSIAIDSSGQRLISVGDDGTSRLWELKTWPPTMLKEFPKMQNIVMYTAFSPNGKKIVTIGKGQPLRILNTEKGSVDLLLTGHENTVFRSLFSPDGEQVATVSADATIRFWDLEAGKELFALRLPTNSGYPVPLWDFDFRCTPSSKLNSGCYIAVPLTRGKLVLYNLGQPYS